MRTKIKNKRKWALIALIVVVALFIGINAKSIGQKFGVLPSGDISLTVPIGGSTVYMDNKKLQVTDTDDATLKIKGLSVDAPHTLIVSKEGYWPWSKSFRVEDKKTIAVSAFNGNAGQAVTEIPSTSSEYPVAVKALSQASAPAKDKMLISRSSYVGIWIKGNDVYASWISNNPPDDFFCKDDLCNHEQKIFHGTAPITSISFYKDRDDVVLLATGGSIFAIEIDLKGTQNFQPVYEGTNTIFVPVSGQNFLYVKDSGKVLKLAI